MPRKYPDVASGEWVRPNMKRYRMACCDCGLVHEITFRVQTYKGGRYVLMKARRNNRSTAALRRSRYHAYRAR